MTRGLLLSICVLIATSALAADPPRKPPTYEQIVAEPHLWPDKVTVKKAIRFPKDPIAAGEAVSLVRCDANDVYLSKVNGDAVFHLPFAETDVVARATQLRQRLTPEQLALDYPVLLARPDLWPAEVTFRCKLTYPNGSEYSNTQPVPIFQFEQDQLWVFHPTNKQKNHTRPQDTDLFVRARDMLALPPEKRVPRLTRALQGKLVPPAIPLEGVKPADPPPGIKYYVLFFAASDNPDIQQTFTDVAKFYGPTKPKHPEVEVVTYGLDQAMIERKSPWRRIDAAQLESLRWLRLMYENDQWPLIVFDAYGRIVPDAAVENATKPKPRLDNLKAILEKPAAEAK